MTLWNRQTAHWGRTEMHGGFVPSASVRNKDTYEPIAQPTPEMGTRRFFRGGMKAFTVPPDQGPHELFARTELDTPAGRELHFDYGRQETYARFHPNALGHPKDVVMEFTNPDKSHGKVYRDRTAKTHIPLAYGQSIRLAYRPGPEYLEDRVYPLIPIMGKKYPCIDIIEGRYPDGTNTISYSLIEPGDSSSGMHDVHVRYLQRYDKNGDNIIDERESNLPGGGSIYYRDDMKVAQFEGEGLIVMDGNGKRVETFCDKIAGDNQPDCLEKMRGVYIEDPALNDTRIKQLSLGAAGQLITSFWPHESKDPLTATSLEFVHHYGMDNKPPKRGSWLVETMDLLSENELSTPSTWEHRFPHDFSSR